MDIETWIGLLTTAAISALLGNCSGDQATLRDCATKGQSHMVGGGDVKCEVIKQPATTAPGG